MAKYILFCSEIIILNSVLQRINKKCLAYWWNEVGFLMKQGIAGNKSHANKEDF
ncbi:MAG: hypothetical protein JW976_02390 [Syntrophaceae bacterium]|nr:hypothetical protein [Syntrophaceae bacterium]